VQARKRWWSRWGVPGSLPAVHKWSIPWSLIPNENTIYKGILDISISASTLGPAFLRAEDNMRVYLDNCCYNRPFDDQKQLRIRLEAEAKLGIQEMILEKRLELAWSYILDFENERNPFEQRKLVVRQWKIRATADTGETREIIEQAERLVQIGFKPKDALHLACAISLRCDYFLTTDDYLIKAGVDIAEMNVTDPISFIRKEFE